MSEAWHKWRDSVPWWDFDRIWNPQNYTCSTFFPEWTIWFSRVTFIVWIIVIVLAVTYVLVRLRERKKRK